MRVNPYELSIHDPAFYNDLYCAESKRRTDNYDKFGRGIDFDGTARLSLTYMSPHLLLRLSLSDNTA